jgi:hypothetical protein
MDSNEGKNEIMQLYPPENNNFIVQSTLSDLSPTA